MQGVGNLMECLLRLQEGSLRGFRLGVIRIPTTLIRGQSMEVIYRE